MFKRNLRKGLAILATSATVLWSVGVFLLVPVVVQAAAGDIVKSADSGAVYVILADGDSVCRLVSEGHYDMWAQYKAKGLARWKDVMTVDTSTYTDKGVCSLRTGSLVRTPANPEVFVIQSDGTKRGFDAWATFVNAGYASGGVYYVTDAVLNSYTTGGKITSSTTAAEIREGQLVKYAGNATVYYITKSGTVLQARQVTTETAYWSNFGINWNLVITIPAAETYTAGSSSLSGAETSINRPTGMTASVPAGTLTFSLASDSPAGKLAPTKSYGNVFTKLTVSGSGTITSITVKKEGLGSRADFSSIYLYVDGAKYTSGRTLNSDSKALFSLGTGLAISGTKTISIVADMAAITATSQHQLGIAAATDIVSTATIAGTYPLMGNVVSTSTTAIGELTITAAAVGDTEIYVGEQQQEVARYTFVSGSAEKVKLNSIRFRSIGSAAISNFANWALYKGGTKLDGVTFTVAGEFVTAGNINLTFDKSQTLLIKLYADIIGGSASTMQFSIEEASDVTSTGDYGYGVTINNTSGATTWTEPKSHTSAITLLSGTLTIAIPGPAAYTVSKKDDNVVIANLSITGPANETMTITKMYAYIAPHASNTGDVEDTIENIQLVQKTGGTQVIDASYGTETNNGSNESFYFANFDVKGATTWDVIFDTADSYATAADKFRFVMIADDDAATVGDNASVDPVQAKNSAGKSLTSTTRDDIKPATTLYGNYVTLSDVSLTVTGVTTDAATAVAKEQNIALIKLQITAGAAGDVKITQMVFEDATGNTADGTYDASNFSLYEVAGTTETLLQSGMSASAATDDFTVTFNSLKNGTGLVIPANTTKYVVAKADFTSGITALEILKIAASADGITAEKSTDGTSVGDSAISGNDVVINGRSVTAAATGKLTISKDTSKTTAATSQVLAGSKGVESLHLKFNADNENVALKYLKLVLVNTGASDSIDKIYLYDGTAKVLEGTYNEDSAYVEFGDASSTFYTFDKSIDKTLTVVTDLRGIGGSAGTADSGDEVKWRLDAETASDTNDSVVADGVASNSPLVYDTTRADSFVLFGTGATEADQDGNILHVRRALMTDITACKLGGTGCTPVDSSTTTLTNGNGVEIFRFKITAAATGNEYAAVDLRDLKLSLAGGAAITLASATIYRTDDSGTSISASTTDSIVAGTGAIYFTADYSSALTGLKDVLPGESIVFVVKANVTDAAAGESIQVSIADLGDQSDEATLTTDFAAGALIWSDNDGVGATADETSWVSWPGKTITDVIGQTRLYPSS